MRKLMAYAVVAILIIQLSITNTLVANTVVGPSDWAQADIDALRNEGILRQDIFQGYNQLITRADYAYLVYKLIESYGISISSIADLSMEYTLVDTQDLYIIGLFKAGVISGYPDDTYRPDQPITRQEICTLYVKALELIGGTFESDETLILNYGDNHLVAGWARPSIAKVLNKGILKGTASNQILPLGYSTVEEALVILYRILNNQGIQADDNLIYNTVYSQKLDYYKGQGYFLDYQLDGRINGIKVYEDYSYKETYTIDNMAEKFQVVDQGIYYISNQNLMFYQFAQDKTVVVIEDVEDFVVVNQEIYCLKMNALVQIDSLGAIKNQVLFNGNLIEMKVLVDQKDQITDYYCRDEQGILYRYYQGEITIVANEVIQFYVRDSSLYYINEGSMLIYQKIGAEGSETVGVHVTDFVVIGHNLLYIIEDTWLYNMNRGSKTLLYTGSGLRLAYDHNYLSLTELVVGNNDYNHLIASFNVKEYLGY